jgi:hypothetical protein
MTNFKVQPAITTIIPALLFVGMLVYLTVVMGRNDRLADDLKKERLTSERLLSEKLSQEKKKVEWELKSTRLDNTLNHANSKLQTLMAELSRKEEDLLKERSSDKSLLIKKQKQRFELLQNKLKEDSVKNAVELEKVLAQNDNLQRTLSENLEEREKYNFEIERLRRLTLNEVGIESMKKNKRLTSRASKTKTIKISLQIPSQTADLTYSILTPDGEKISLDEKNSSIKISGIQDQKPSQAFYLSPEIQLSTIEKTQMVEITYTSTSRLQPGIYKFFVKSTDELVGSIMLRLE